MVYKGSRLIAIAQTNGLICLITPILAIKGNDVATQPKSNKRPKFLELNKSVSKPTSCLKMMYVKTHSDATPISTQAMGAGSIVLTNRALMEEKVAAKKAANKDQIIPSQNRVSKLKMKIKPITAIDPTTPSFQFHLVAVIQGATTETKIALVLRTVNAVDTLETLMAVKKQIQCAAMMIPESVIIAHSDFKKDKEWRL